jgi:SAM-dependent methyltransferase
MVVLAIGYYLGGALERMHSPRTLCICLMAACAYTQVVNVILLDRVADLTLDLRDRLSGLEHLEVGLPAAFISTLLYGPPVLMMSMISPCLIRLQSRGASADAGKTSGFIMSLSTGGSIFGTLIASYVLIPSLGVRTTVATTNAVFFGVVALALITSARSAQRRALGAASIGAAVLLALVPNARSDFEPVILQDTESMYGRVRVVADKDEQDRKFIAYQSTMSYWHTVTYPEEPLRSLPGSFYLAPALVENAKNMLILGSAAGGAIRQAQTVMPDVAITGVDLDPAVHEIATKFFGVNPAKAKLIARDARHFIDRDKERYDFIIVDVYAGEFLPPHCISREFFARVREHLSPDGVVFINTNMYDVPFELPHGASEPMRVNRHLEQTLRDAGFASIFPNNFFHSAVLYPTAVSLETFRNKLLAVAADPRKPDATRAALGLMARTTVEAGKYERHYQPFTDVWAPELMLELKSNHARLYSALAKAVQPQQRDEVQHPAVRAIRAQLFAERTAGSTVGAIQDAGALIRSLNQIQQPLTAADLELAARYLRFGYGASTELDAHSPWARLAASYAHLYSAGNSNDYERLATVLGELDSSS